MDVQSIRNDFPTIRNSNSIYMDSACQSLKPDCVIESVMRYYNEFPACGGRSVHSMATSVSIGIDESREKLAEFFNYDDPLCFAFTKNCTEGMNIVAHGFGLRRGDAVLTTDVEHNSNHVQWIQMAEDVGIKRRYCKTSKEGVFDIEEFKRSISKDVKLISLGHGSNVTGCSVPLKEIVEIAHDRGIPVLADGAQAAPHKKVDLKDLDVDFYCASLHKMLAPTGVGMMFGKMDLLKKLKPMMGGGGIVGLTTYDSIKVSPPPEKFEAGLSNYSGIIGVKYALEYLQKVGMDEIGRHETMLQTRIQAAVEEIKGLSIVGPDDPALRGGVFSFNIAGLNSHDIAMMLDNMGGVMIRSGMHCAHPFFVSRGIDGCARASVYLYNDESDVDRFTQLLKKIAETFA
ncbi:MAG: cysteine desulfurase [Candidatus Methanomethylophilaceae archaeon]|nr:cysteine desulfurase [Candidatus Methanomethylophilaceae archaeon]